MFSGEERNDQKTLPKFSSYPSYLNLVIGRLNEFDFKMRIDK